jgi:hypothetical protein
MRFSGVQASGDYTDRLVALATCEHRPPLLGWNLPKVRPYVIEVHLKIQYLNVFPNPLSDSLRMTWLDRRFQMNFSRDSHL